MSEKEVRPGYLIGLNVDLGSGRMLQFSTNLPVGATVADFNAELDKLVGVCDRQQARCVIPVIEADLAREKAQRNACAEDIARLDAESNGKTLSSATRAAKDNAKVTLARMDGRIAEVETTLAKTREQAV